MHVICSFQRNSSSLSPEHNKYEWSGNRSPDVASESGKRRKIDDKVCCPSCLLILYDNVLFPGSDSRLC